MENYMASQEMEDVPDSELPYDPTNVEDGDDVEIPVECMPVKTEADFMEEEVKKRNKDNNTGKKEEISADIFNLLQVSV